MACTKAPNKPIATGASNITGHFCVGIGLAPSRDKARCAAYRPMASGSASSCGKREVEYQSSLCIGAPLRRVALAIGAQEM